MSILEIVIKIIEISLQEYLKNLKQEYQNNISKALLKYLRRRTFSKVFIANFEHVFVSWDFISDQKPVMGANRRIIYRVIGL